ncbi:MAG: hypothetical protein ACLQGP_22470 [Isosphaeraceae bacterium]
MTTLTPELRQEIEKAGDEPVRIEDPENQTAYVLIRAEVYDRIKPAPHLENLAAYQVPEGIRRSKEAFLRDLPSLMARKRLRGRWALYHGDKQVGIWRNAQRLDRAIIKRGLKEDECYAGVICPHEDEYEIEHSLMELEDFEPSS